MHALRLLFLVTLAACGPAAEPDPTGPRALTTDDGWSLAEADEDPFAGVDRPEAPTCPSAAHGAEGAYFEVDTGICEYGTFVQPLLAPIVAGLPVHLVLWHLVLWAPEPAEAHAAIGVGDETLWEARIPIPMDEAVHDLEVVPVVSHGAGENVWFHIHNHGTNNWRLLPLEQ